MRKLHRLVVAAVAAVAAIGALAPGAATAASAETGTAAVGCATTVFPAGGVMARAAVSRGCRSASGRAVADASEAAFAVPGAIRPDTNTTITIVSTKNPATPFVTGATVTATGPQGNATINVTAVTADRVTATIGTPSVEEFLTVTVTNHPSGFTYGAMIDVRNASGEFHPQTPTRVFDSRFNDATRVGPAGRLAAERIVEAPVAGISGLPATGIAAVAVNVTAVDPAADGFLTAWPSQTAKPDASSINYARSHTVANLVTVGLSPDGGLDLAASTDTDVILDVVGWYAAAPASLPDTSTVASSYIPISPERRTDTRFPMSNPINKSTFLVDGPLHAGETRTLSLDSDPHDEFAPVDAVALNVTVSGSTAPGFLTIWPADEPRLNASNVNFGTGDTIPNMVIVRISDLHQLNFYNSAGNTDVIVDLVGLYATPFFQGLVFESITPTRIIDSRLGHGLPARPLGANETAAVSLAGLTSPIPPEALAVTMNAVIADSSTPTGFVTIYPADETQPNVSNLNLQLGRAAANEVMTPLSFDGANAIKIFNANGPANLIADVTGFFS
ncbi:MAG: hypothetical protein QOD72_1048 [Acidimicrobiaceae bacterium]|nr:hypothetical protein [Acidimicrobiaceae bacterium]